MFPPKLSNFAPAENKSRAENEGWCGLNYGANYGDNDWESWAETAKPRKSKNAVPCDAERLFYGYHVTRDT